MAFCNVCFRHCNLNEGQTGPCGARIASAGQVKPKFYGKVSSLALDPIEKKPLKHFYPGSKILSVGSLGCNLHCPFCQNHEIAQTESKDFFISTEEIPPDKLADLAEHCQPNGNIGLAFTYNEPLVGWEYVRDTAKAVHDRGLVNVLVTNGCAEIDILKEISPYIDAMNIDLKGFTDQYYRNVLGGDLQMVLDFIQEAVKQCHVELTTLIIPGMNDSTEEMTALSEWISGLQNIFGGKQGKDIPLHISRFFPRYHMTEKRPTDIKRIYELVYTAKKNLRYVYPGNC